MTTRQHTAIEGLLKELEDLTTTLEQAPAHVAADAKTQAPGNEYAYQTGGLSAHVEHAGKRLRQLVGYARKDLELAKEAA